MIKNKRNVSRESGQAIVLIVMAMVGLVGLTALAVDGGNAYSDRRHAQNAADTAALAGALAQIRQYNIADAAKHSADLNGYNNDHVTNDVEEIGRASCRKECRSRWSPYH